MTERAIAPIYVTERPNVPIRIHEGNFEVRIPKILFCKGCVEFRWQPLMDIWFSSEPVEITPDVLKLLNSKPVILNIPTNPPISCDAIITKNTKNIDEVRGITLELSGVADKYRNDDSGVSCDEIVFHIMNMPNFLGDPIAYPSNPAGWARRRISLNYDDWEIVIDGVENIEFLTEALRNYGGFAITHVGCLRRKYGETFKFGDGVEQLKELGYFLSFSLGRWCHPVLLVGKLRGDIVCRDFSAWRIDPWKGNFYWCPEVWETRSLNEAYNGFLSKRHDPKWRDILAWIIELYIQANAHTSIEIAVLHAFNALDMLASAYNINKMKEVERIKDVISKCGLDRISLPTNIHAFYDSFYKNHCKHLQKTTDGATILTDFRDGVVHGNVQVGNKWCRPSLYYDGISVYPQVPIDIRLKVKEVGLWYLELSLLYLFGYTGLYRNRLSVSRSDINVPWAPKSNISNIV